MQQSFNSTISRALAALVFATLVACTTGGSHSDGNSLLSSGTSRGTLALPTASDSATAPRIYGASTGAQPGDVVSLEGVNFVAGSEVWLATSGAPIQLPVVSSSTSSQLAAELPSSLSGELIVWITNGEGTSNSVQLNAAGSSCASSP